MRSRFTALAAAVLVAAAVVQAPASGATPAAPLPSAASWGAPGPYEVTVEIEAVTTFYRPKHMNGRHPVVIWGNGTFAIPGVYTGLLRHWASHGIIVAASNSTQSNPGLSMRAGIDTLTHRNANPGSVYHQHVNLDRIASAGHSQGGAGAVNAALDPRVDTVVAIQPGPLTDPDWIDVPTLFLSGQRDLIVWPALVRALFNDADHVPAVYGELRGATHLSIAGDGGASRAPATAWLRAWLLDDPVARAAFFGPCGYCSDGTTWSDFKRNAKAAALPAT
ncbi:acetylxylan esterase [Actinocorallia sp. API 0066]|uniref:poly(ethylene terephthalate) hydrolase family protein n=1 Tax=Actinocorallia sp. API 0066 TaxID=2896846 RepID=UPI002714FF26|nr:acetylxylan esterase [Actinocorallia sp. API 0066]